MICTSNYRNFHSDRFAPVAISKHLGLDNPDYHGEYYSKLVPEPYIWHVWHNNNKGKISEEANNRYYVQEYWNQVLSKLNPQEVYNELNNRILLSYEPNTDFCHRHIVAAWFEILLGETVPEVKVKDYQIEEVDRPEYIKEYLEDAMRFNRNMRGFHSLRALYLFEKGEKLELLADELEAKTGECHDDYRQAACFFRCNADMAEEEYNKRYR